MFKLVDKSEQVEAFYDEFFDLIESEEIFDERLHPFGIGHQGGAVTDEANYSSRLNIWSSPGNLSWNAFGVGRVPSMVVQINFQDYDSNPRRVGSVFAVDQFGNPTILHRGHIGGGKSGVGLGLMQRECRAERVILQEADGEATECFLVGQLRSEFFAMQLANFVLEVQRVKSLSDISTSALSGIAASLLKLENNKFSKERTGTTTRVNASEVNLTHGLVVSELERQLRPFAMKRKWDSRTDRHRDLMLFDGTALKVLFEIKTKVSSQSLCTALGQLLMYSSAAPEAILVAVLPEEIPKDVAAQLIKWKVQILYYNWKGETIRFTGFKKFVDGIS